MNRNGCSNVLPRIYTTAAQRQQWIRAYQRSGLTQREFARRHQLGISTLCKWLRETPVPQVSRLTLKTAARCEATPQLQEIPLTALVGNAPWVAELVLPSGLVLRMGAGLSGLSLDRLLRELGC